MYISTLTLLDSSGTGFNVALWIQERPRSNSPLPAATEVEEEEALMALADLSGSELLVRWKLVAVVRHAVF